VIALPWISRSGLIASQDMSAADPSEIYSNIESRISELMEGWLEEADPGLPLILTAHASVQGAKFGSERMVMLGSDLVLPGSLVKNPRFDYVALGHIHKPQDLNEGQHPPVIYPGSIERVDFGEAADDRYFVIADVQRGRTQVEWKKLEGVRRFIDRRIVLTSSEGVTENLKSALPMPKEIEGAILRLTVDYPREFDPLIDEAALRKYTETAFEFHLARRPQMEARIRLPADQTVSSLSPLELLDQYWRAAKVEEADALQKLAQEILADDNEGPGASL
jgi:exonuclease SbcD